MEIEKDKVADFFFLFEEFQQKKDDCNKNNLSNISNKVQEKRILSNKKLFVRESYYFQWIEPNPMERKRSKRIEKKLF